MVRTKQIIDSKTVSKIHCHAMLLFIREKIRGSKCSKQLKNDSLVLGRKPFLFNGQTFVYTNLNLTYSE